MRLARHCFLVAFQHRRHERPVFPVSSGCGGASRYRAPALPAPTCRVLNATISIMRIWLMVREGHVGRTWLRHGSFLSLMRILTPPSLVAKVRFEKTHTYLSTRGGWQRQLWLPLFSHRRFCRFFKTAGSGIDLFGGLFLSVCHRLLPVLAAPTSVVCLLRRDGDLTFCTPRCRFICARAGRQYVTTFAVASDASGGIAPAQFRTDKPSARRHGRRSLHVGCRIRLPIHWCRFCGSSSVSELPGRRRV